MPVYQSSGFENILLPKDQSPYTGKEKVKRLSNGVVLYKDQYGSNRFVLYIDNTAVSALQIIDKQGEIPKVANVITIKDERRKGYARIVWNEAKKIFPNIVHSKNLSPDGEIYAEKMLKKGGEIDNHSETYKKWRSLVNMSYGELKKFYNSKEWKQAGLSSSEASKQGISSGRESARWIMKMKTTPKAEWTPAMWKWAKKQISFISRMSGNEGELYDEKGNKTRKHTSLLIWGHNPEKYESGGNVSGSGSGLSQRQKELFKYLVENWQEPFFRNEHTGTITDYNTLLKEGVILKGKASSGGNVMYYSDNSVDNIDLAYKLVQELGISDTIGGTAITRAYKHKIQPEPEKPQQPEPAPPEPEIEEELLQLEDFDFDKDKYKQYLGYYNENQLLPVYSDTELSAIDVPKYNLVHGHNIYPFINISDAVSCCQTINDENVHIRYAETGKIILNKSDISEISSGKKSISDYDLKSFEFGGIMEEELQVEDFYAEDYIKNEIAQAESVMFSNQSRLLKAMICKAKIDTAETQIANTSSAIEKNTWQEVKNIWQEYFQDIKYGTSKISFKKGGDVSECGCASFSQGGLAYGNSHDEGGIPLTVKSTGQKIEIEGAEGVVNKRSMQIDEKVQFEGKKLTPCEVVSKINQMGGGVKFKCEDVEEIIEKDGEY